MGERRKYASFFLFCLSNSGHTYFQALQEQFHATVVKEHLTVIGGLISDVPEGTPGELHYLVTLQSQRERDRNRVLLM